MKRKDLGSALWFYFVPTSPSPKENHSSSVKSLLIPINSAFSADRCLPHDTPLLGCACSTDNFFPRVGLTVTTRGAGNQSRGEKSRNGVCSLDYPLSHMEETRRTRALEMGVQASCPSGKGGATEGALWSPCEPPGSCPSPALY